MPFLALPAQVRPPDNPDDNAGGSTGGGGGEVGPSSAAITITAADGTVYDLTDRYAILTTVGKTGFDATQYNVFTDAAPMVAGEIFRSARAIARELTLPIYVRGDTRAEFLARKRDFFSRLSPSHGLATLTVSENDGTRRSIGFYFAGQGGEGSAARDQAGPNWARYQLVLRCPEPYWRGPSIHREFAAPSTALFLSNPFLPFRVQSSQSFGATEFDNDGDQLAYPVWTVTGPSSGVILRRVTPILPDATLTINSTLTSTQSLTIDCHPDVLRVARNDGTNLWPGLADGSEFWQVAPGLNQIEVSVTGAGPTSRVILDVEPRYETA